MNPQKTAYIVSEVVKFISFIILIVAVYITKGLNIVFWLIAMINFGVSILFLPNNFLNNLVLSFIKNKR
ncbi:hypothetical protein PL11_005695 [Lentilactobacillus curieae]|uniref:Uncharacterized protein n=1 Tax=Lentilactobacillus curieae TaxID=1138822 RepID=A0A1S6QIN9_9LACO|nr:hypothetical protein PL11_005695 [Lentilactobacillus curieae]